MDTFRKEQKELSDNQEIDVKAIKELAENLERGLETIQTHDADPRCVAVAKTKLEECVMWAVKGITK